MFYTWNRVLFLFAVGTSSVGIAAYASEMHKHFASTLFAGRLVLVFWLILVTVRATCMMARAIGSCPALLG